MTYHFPNKAQETQEEEELPEEEPPEDGFADHLEEIREATAEELNNSVHSQQEDLSPRSQLDDREGEEMKHMIQDESDLYI